MHKKTPVLESFFNKVTGGDRNFIKKGTQAHACNFIKKETQAEMF